MPYKSLKQELEEGIRTRILDEHGLALDAARVPVWAVNRVALDCATNTARALREDGNWQSEILPGPRNEGLKAIPEKLRFDIGQSAIKAAESIIAKNTN